MDRSIGKILKSLDDLDLAENTLVIFTSDNGHFLKRSASRQQGHLYEGGIRCHGLFGGLERLWLQVSI